ncbi:gluzincin family metallopeptidase [Chitinophaga japonensis]|uniref:Peptidase M4 n=1 Tax=Chitinophaga japonensis TaxID=104662 RepID=A0A562SMF3_CHIJA|nr:hypothetical protein [Chitinophaga japonensis]TWI82489.1 hypothetical protein LX66_5062 [Chitinophaga japonensis]
MAAIPNPPNYYAKTPPFRKLRGYAFDPSLSLKIDTAAINDIIYKVPWEPLTPGPVGEYIEVVDYDPTVGRYYKAVNLDDDYILAQDGMDPSESDPQFHQQMVYAVAMTTIRNFERALGRKVLWESRRILNVDVKEEYVRRLRIYPHAMREANAYYSPVKKALLFGYFASTPADETLHMPNSVVFTCLSHDIIAHEITHAILDGLHNYYNEPTNPDVLAFHEAFADIVALFQHFTFPEVLKHQISKTRGDLGAQNLLGQLAQEFGSAIGDYGSLRDAIGGIDETTREWQPHVPDPAAYRREMEPHARGSILVAAVFEAFLAIYKSRIADLLRIASNGTGILRQGDIPPDLTDRLANEAAKAAGHVLTMCIRAIDYCPPIDITFGDYLRAIITADMDVVADDNRDYRLAFIDAFRRRGIYPEGVKTLSVESLRFPLRNIGYIQGENGTANQEDHNGYTSETTKELLGIVNGFLRGYGNEIKYVNDREKIYYKTREYITGLYEEGKPLVPGLHSCLNERFTHSMDFARLTGLAFVENFRELGLRRSGKYEGASFQVLKLRLVSRVGPNGAQVNNVVFSIVQRAGVVFRNGEIVEHYTPARDPLSDKTDAGVPVPEGGFEFRGACTLIFDLDSQRLKYVITKPILDVDSLDSDRPPALNLKRIRAQYAYQHGETDTGINEYFRYFGNGFHQMAEPFAFLHQH